MNTNIINGKNVEHPLMKQEIDWRKNILKVWTFRKLILKICSIGAVAGIFMVLGIPEEYTASTLVAHEVRQRVHSLAHSVIAGYY